MSNSESDDDAGWSSPQRGGVYHKPDLVVDEDDVLDATGEVSPI
jgi:hypothetical protein